MTRAGFFAFADSLPDRVVLIDPSDQKTTAGDLLAGMNQVTHGLASLGLVAGDTVAVLMTNRIEFLELYGAAIQSGLSFVGINWHLGKEEIAYILEDSQASVVVSEAQFADSARLASAQAGLPDDRVFAVGDAGLRPFSELIAGQSTDSADRQLPGQMMFYTSGTTGRPKGVRKVFPPGYSDDVALITGIGVRGQPVPSDQGAPLPPSDAVHLSSGPFYHALPIATAVGALDSGGLLVMMDRWTPERFLELVERHRVTNAVMVPIMFHRLLGLADDVRRAADVSSLQSVAHAGAPCPIEVKRRMIEWFGPIITESYSSTEGAGTSVTSEEWLARPGTVGRPVAGVQILVLDEHKNPCPPGTPGLVYFTPTLWEFEYRNDEEKTLAARHEGLFTVGDIGYLDDDGYLFLCDRQSDTIISGGVNIYPAEVEATLLQHPAVRDAAVIGVPDDEWGEEVRAVVEARQGLPAPEGLGAELIEFCRSRIAHYKCPRAVDFVESLSRDPNGKLRKGALRDSYWQGRARRI